MVTVGLLATVVAKAGKSDEVQAFLTSALELAEQEPETVAWFAFKIDEQTFGIFDVLPTDQGRRDHLAGPIAAALGEHADELLASPPDIRPVDILAAKL